MSEISEALALVQKVEAAEADINGREFHRFSTLAMMLSGELRSAKIDAWPVVVARLKKLEAARQAPA